MTAPFDVHICCVALTDKFDFVHPYRAGNSGKKSSRPFVIKQDPDGSSFHPFAFFDPEGFKAGGPSRLIISFNPLNISLKEKRRKGWLAQGGPHWSFAICSIISLFYKISPPGLHFWHGFFIRNKAKETKNP